jgi:hypothetical protein
MSHFFKDHFDKILVVGLLVSAAFWVTHLIHGGVSDAPSVDKAWQVLFTVLGLLTGLITGQRFMARKADNGNGVLPPNGAVPSVGSGDPITAAPIENPGDVPKG